MKTSTMVLFIATVLILILQSKSTHAREFDDLAAERRAGGALNWDREDNGDTTRLLKTLLKRVTARESGPFSEEKRGSSKAIDHKLDTLHFALWCRRMGQC